MLTLIERWLNRRTMYEVVIGGLLAMALYALVVSALGGLFYAPLELIALFVAVVASCLGANTLFAKLWNAPRNDASTLITALILFFLLWPSTDITDLGVAVLASVLAIGSKYVIAWRKQHLFNPVAFGAFVLSLFGIGGAVWWIGSPLLAPATVIVGTLIVWKIRRVPLAVGAVLASVLVTLVLEWQAGAPPLLVLAPHLLSWPILFFASVMVTEPQTAPGRTREQWLYGAGVGALSAVPFHIGPIFSSPELALLVGNLFSYAVSMKQRLVLTLVSREELAKNTYEYAFSTPRKPSFEAGQYLEWTLPHSPADDRGIRRYFTIASAPSNEHLRLGVRMAAAKGSSFKRALATLPVGGKLFASQRAGDFVLPCATSAPLVWIAGGIGITPFVSMLREMLANQEKRQITLFFANVRAEDVAYRDVLARAEQELGVRVIYVFSEQDQVLDNATVEHGFVTEEMLHRYVSQLASAEVYLSGPSGMVTVYKHLVRSAGVPMSRIKTDYFPGFA